MLPQPPPSPESLQPPQPMPPAPPGSAGRIWIATLVPLGTLLLMLLWIMAEGTSGRGTMTGRTFETLLGLQGLVTLVCWGFFCVAVNQRLRGNTKVILMIFYPIIQAGVQFVIFFCGCLALFSMSGL